jgi:hypothetical protein
MSYPQFDDQNNISIQNKLRDYTRIASSSFLVRYNIAKDEESAKKIYLLLSVLIFATSIGIVIYNYTKNNKSVKPKYKLSQEILQKLPDEIQYNIIKN